MNVQVYNESPYEPTYGTEGSAGLDLQANIGVERIIHPCERWKISTGIYMAIPEGFEGQVRGRSGLRLNHGIVVPVGTIDSDYRGEICVILFNLSKEDFILHPGDKIGQLIISPIVRITPVYVASKSQLPETVRGDGGFGSTGR